MEPVPSALAIQAPAHRVVYFTACTWYTSCTVRPTTYTCHTRALVHVHHVYHTRYPRPVATPRACRRSAQIDARRKIGASVNIPWTYLEIFRGVHVPPVPPMGYAPAVVAVLPVWLRSYAARKHWTRVPTVLVPHGNSIMARHLSEHSQAK